MKMILREIRGYISTLQYAFMAWLSVTKKKGTEDGKRTELVQDYVSWRTLILPSENLRVQVKVKLFLYFFKLSTTPLRHIGEDEV
jgi:hypothetical protein